MDRHLKGSGDRLQFKVYVNGELTDSEAGVTVSIVDGAGTAVGSPAAAAHPSTGVYEHQPTAAQMGTLDTYTVSWTVTLNGEERDLTTQYQVVGGFYFSIAEARAFRNGKFANTTTFPTQAIIDAREEVETLFEQECRRAFVPRGRRVVLSGEGTNELLLGDWHIRQIYSLSTREGALETTYSVSQLSDLYFGSRVLSRKDGTVFPYGDRNVTVHYEYGLSQVPPDVKRAALILLQHRLLDSDLSDRTESFTDEAGTTTFSRPGENQPIGIPEVDAVIKRWKVGGGAFSVSIR